MTVFVDNARRRTVVAGTSGRFSRLTADTAVELHAFAARLHLPEGWFCPDTVSYAVTDGRRKIALDRGALRSAVRALPHTDSDMKGRSTRAHL